MFLNEYAGLLNGPPGLNAMPTPHQGDATDQDIENFYSQTINQIKNNPDIWGKLEDVRARVTTWMKNQLLVKAENDAYNAMIAARNIAAPQAAAALVFDSSGRATDESVTTSNAILNQLVADQAYALQQATLANAVAQQAEGNKARAEYELAQSALLQAQADTSNAKKLADAAMAKIAADAEVAAKAAAVAAKAKADAAAESAAAAAKKVNTIVDTAINETTIDSSGNIGKTSTTNLTPLLMIAGLAFVLGKI